VPSIGKKCSKIAHDFLLAFANLRHFPFTDNPPEKQPNGAHYKPHFLGNFHFITPYIRCS